MAALTDIRIQALADMNLRVISNILNFICPDRIAIVSVLSGVQKNSPRGEY